MNKDELIRSTIAAIERGDKPEDALSNLISTVNELARVSLLLEIDNNKAMKEVLSKKDIQKLVTAVASRRILPSPPEPQGKNKDSDWWIK